jgi:hypothetical protein
VRKKEGGWGKDTAETAMEMTAAVTNVFLSL